MIRNLPANAGDADSTPGLGRSPGKGNSNPFQCSIPWTKESGKLQYMGSQIVRHDLAAKQ